MAVPRPSIISDEYRNAYGHAVLLAKRHMRTVAYYAQPDGAGGWRFRYVFARDWRNPPRLEGWACLGIAPGPDAR